MKKRHFWVPFFQLNLELERDRAVLESARVVQERG